ncbi:hypothetical protein [Haloplanus halophilus]|uniref:hypothetical protein n=1 Tax=Haloplanus halophilus TaxID=2949993 RepID=UPI00203D1B72|nr:hypothetical protein [Haloplanus sp. GDY1]
MSQTAQDIADERREQQLREGAIGQAAQSAQLDQAARGRPQTFIREMGDPDISAPADASNFEEMLAPELSHHHVFGNITREDFEGLKITNQGLAMQVKAEHPRKAGPSSKCTGQYRREMYGEDKVVLTDDKAREVDSTLGEEGTRTMMQSKSVEGMAFKGATQVKSVVKTEGAASDDDGGGLMDSIRGALGIGGDD